MVPPPRLHCRLTAVGPAAYTGVPVAHVMAEMPARGLTCGGWAAVGGLGRLPVVVGAAVGPARLHTLVYS
jgi:hypothetical protein